MSTATTRRYRRDQERALVGEPGPLFAVRVADLRPAAPDGEAWDAAVLDLARAIARQGAGVLPSHLRARARACGVGAPPHGQGAWGRLYARLVAAGWRKEFAGTTSTTPSRNAARDVWRYWPPEAA